MITKSGITAHYLRSRLDYDPNTGVFRWRAKPGVGWHENKWNARYAGTVAGHFNVNGYVVITIDGVKWHAHRLAWLHFHGEHPQRELDHKDGVRSHNWINNLRTATTNQNRWNSRKRSRNTSGVKGVSWDKSRQKWMATIMVNRRFINLGRFATKAEARQAYADAAKRYHGKFAKLD